MPGQLDSYYRQQAWGGGHAGPSNWATQNLISFPALHPSPFTLWEIPLLNNSHSVCPPISHFSASQTHTHSFWVGGGGTPTKCRDNSQHGSWWEIECYNGVTNLHSRESSGPLTWVTDQITSLPPKHSFSEMPHLNHSKVACWEYFPRHRKKKKKVCELCWNLFI